MRGTAPASLYRKYMRQIDTMKVLTHYGVGDYTEASSHDGTTEIIHSCLIDKVFRHHTNGDMNPSASANMDKKLYVCHSLGWGGDLMHFIAKMERKEHFADIAPIVGAFLSGTALEGQDFAEELNTLLRSPGAYSQSLPAYSDRVLEPWLRPHPYWEARGISPEAILDLRLGYDPDENRLVFPHYVEGHLVGWQKRLAPDTAPPYPKYRNSLGFPKSETLYNLDRARQYHSVVVVESPMSVARAYSLGIPNVVATFGASVSPQQIDLLKDFSQVIIWSDDDLAGRKGEKKLVEGLYRHTRVDVVTPSKGRDLGDSSSEKEVLFKISMAIPAALAMANVPRAGP